MRSEILWRESRHAVRSLFGAPGFTVLAVLTTASPWAQTPFDRAVRWDKRVSPPLMDCRLEPAYTPAARAAGISGVVVVEVVVERDGSVSDARVLRSIDPQYGLDDAALTEARACHGTPPIARLKMAPNGTITRIPFLFRLHRPGILEGDPDRESADDKAFAGGAYSAKSPGVVPPTVAHQEFARYTVDGMQTRIQGDVFFDVVIGPDGRVRALRRLLPVEGLGGGLDTEAEAALKKWRFKPGTLNGKPVAVVMVATMTFRLH
jgi:TonB family protein